MANAQIEIEALADRSKRRVETLVHEGTQDLIETVVIRSPVDLGFFRGSWYVSLDDPSAGNDGEVDPSGVSVIAEMSLSVNDSKIGQVIYVLNSAAYARKLEDGSSSQAPQGMVKVTVAEAPEIFEATAKRIAR